MVREKGFDKADGHCICLGSIRLYQDSNGDLAITDGTNTATLDMSASDGNNITVTGE
ncbi:MAG: hypothetical protein ACTSPB_02095 [Candidatus Thorarchaeota archaeon]